LKIKYHLLLISKKTLSDWQCRIASEVFEGFNAIFRYCSVFQTPRSYCDIAISFEQEIVKHILQVVGGSTKNGMVTAVLQCKDLLKKSYIAGIDRMASNDK